MPFGFDCEYEDFDACVQAQLQRGRDQEAARRICGAIMRDTEERCKERAQGKSVDWPDDMNEVRKQESFDPPKGVAEAAARGLALRREFGRGGTSVGLARARDLANRRPVSLETIGRMVSFFARHGAQGAGKPPGAGEDPSNGYIAWLLWGGDPGRRWAESIWERERD